MLSDTSHQTTDRLSLADSIVLNTNVKTAQRLPVFLVAAFLVSIPVFIQAPLVRVQPWISLTMTLVWLVGGLRMLRSQSSALWGDLAIGFSWTWLAGSIYWGWLRENPFVHLPVEAIGLPIVLILIAQNRLLVGSWFYLGSLLGTAITDIYFYWVDLIPYWRQVMAVEPSAVGTILNTALSQIQNPLAAVRATVLLVVLLITGSIAIKANRIHHWAFAGAVLSTIFVDALFLAVVLVA